MVTPSPGAQPQPDPGPDDGPATELALPAPRPRRPERDSSTTRTSDDLTGRTVDHYRILELVGSGGMAVVYKAEDTRLRRTVALKFLPAAMTRDPVAKGRFLHEARAASALDHPNVCTIFDVGESDDGRLYLVMPCYSGETLKRRIERGRLPVAEALDIAIQVGQGLAKAHAQGIIHRDIKPANLMITPDGLVKILDFGLAKLAGAAGFTRAGFCVGTPTYMSPEQVRGQLDHRTDLWSLGVVLFEALTGTLPFVGETDQEILHAVLHNEPQPLTSLRPDAPPELERILAGMLCKDPGDRYPTLERAIAELRTVPVVGPELETLPAPSLESPSRRPARGSRARWTPLTVAAAVAVLAALAAGIFLFLRADRGGEDLRPATFTRLTNQEGRESFPSLSPDGASILYTRDTGNGADIYRQRVGGGNPIDLTPGSPGDDTQPAFSPDGQWIAFRSERGGGGLYLMGSTGESPRRLASFGYNPAWSPDGRSIAFATQGVAGARQRSDPSEIWRLEIESGERRRIVAEDGVQPSWSPDGRRIAYWGLRKGGSGRILRTVPAGGGEPVTAVDGGTALVWNPVWSSDGGSLYYLSNRSGAMNLWRVRLDRSGEPRGKPEAIMPSETSMSFLSLSRDGRRMAYTVEDVKSNLERLTLAAPAVPAAPAAPAATAPVMQGTWAVRSAEISPQGRWIVFDVSQPQEDLFVIGEDGTGFRQLTDDAAKDRIPHWTPGGDRIVFYSDRGGRYEAWSIRPDGSDLSRLVGTPGDQVFEPVPSPDGRWLAFSLGFSGAALADLGAPAAARRPVRLPIPAPGQVFGVSSWSPDGRWLAGSDRQPGVLLFSRETGTYERLSRRGSAPIWLPDGSALLCIDEGRILAIDRRTGQTRLVAAPPPGSSYLGVSVSPDGRTLYVVREIDGGNVYLSELR